MTGSWHFGAVSFCMMEHFHHDRICRFAAICERLLTQKKSKFEDACETQSCIYGKELSNAVQFASFGAWDQKL